MTLKIIEAIIGECALPDLIGGSFPVALLVTTPLPHLPFVRSNSWRMERESKYAK